MTKLLSLWAGVVCLVFAGLATAATPPDPLQLSVFDRSPYPGGWGSRLTSTVTLPDAPTMQQYDTLKITLQLDCQIGHCPGRDHLAQLFVCDTPQSEHCDTELARWVTAYGKPGAWTTDISPLLALLKEGGLQAFAFSTPFAYDLTISLQMSNTGKGRVPWQAIPLFAGGTFDESYNAQHPAKIVTIPEGVRHADIYALVTGHGWGQDRANCAEFCNHSHTITVNGVAVSRDFPEAGSLDGCAQRVGEGVVPDQFGNWRFGRAGWCPGQDVRPWVAEVTTALRAGPNTIGYQALFDGRDYRPVRRTNPHAEGFAANIVMTSYLVLWR